MPRGLAPRGLSPRGLSPRGLSRGLCAGLDPRGLRGDAPRGEVMPEASKQDG